MDTLFAIPNSPQLPESERPVHRLREAGPSALSTTELLAVIIGCRNAVEASTNLLASSDAVCNLARLSPEDLEQVDGIGPAKAAQLTAAIELGRRISQSSRSDRCQVCSPADAASLVMWDMRALDQEVVKVLLFDTRNRVLKIHEIYKGSLNTSMIRVGELFREAIKLGAASIIVVHNHPSGDPSPSPDDVAVTKMMVDAGEMLDIAVHDHIIIGDNRFVSLKERGLGFA